MNLNMDNCWGIISGLINLCLEKMEVDGEHCCHCSCAPCPAAIPNHIFLFLSSFPRRFALPACRQCIPTTMLRVNHTQRGKVVQRSNPSLPRAPMLWRCRPLVAAPSGVLGRHNPLCAIPSPLFPTASCSVFIRHSFALHCSSLLLTNHASALPPATFPGKYLLVRDANKPQLCLYAIPAGGSNPGNHAAGKEEDEDDD
jgi:hypothetical protein